MIACNEGHVSVVEDLMEAGAGVNLQNRRGNTALIYVCKRGHMKLLEKLVQAGADLNLQNDCRNTPLIVAFKGGHVGVVKELVKKGADVNLQDKWGNTPLIYACKAGYTSVVEELVKAGADVTLRGRLGNTPLIAAVRTCPLSTVKYLVEHKADIITQVVDVNVLVVYTALILNKPEIVKYLIQEQNKIIPGRYHGNVHLFNCLLDIRHAGVKTDSRDDVVVTNRSVWRMGRGGDLLRTISEGDCDVLRRLLSVGLDVNQLIQLNKPDVRPLLYTLIDERYGVLHRTEVGVLFGAGMDVNFRLKYKEYDSVLDRNGVSVLERTRRLMCKYSESKDYTDKRRVSGYKRVMCEIKKHVRRHSV
ncbi:kinase D-interacting substrate of 220 kDa-like [Ostrea edulis]|uniref:kinase D-interacting substrate of 220 kDa-like n=1 Tax=Ostrea edulis TaxID=37623 RepID=UPI0024AFD6CA|nr:kinase D-interacting substrate of 220 kDa-like [Ostrea edulis]